MCFFFLNMYQHPQQIKCGDLTEKKTKKSTQMKIYFITYAY